MSMYINLFLSAIKPLSFFLPCSAIIFGSGLAAFNGVVDGVLFTSLLVISILGQISLNLANDYQRAFLTYSRTSSTNNERHKQVRISMLKLLLGCYLVFLLSLILLSALTLEDSILSYVLVIGIAVSTLTVFRLKTRGVPVLHKAIDGMQLLSQFFIAGLLPSLLAYHLHTASMSGEVLLIAGVFSLATLLPYFSDRVLAIISKHDPVRSDQMPTILTQTLKLQKLVMALLVICVLSLILLGLTPILVCFSLIASPSLFASCMTLQHFPEVDTAQSQKSKVTLATFVFAVLFIVGLMFR